MRTKEEFNEKYKAYLDGESGMLIELPSVLAYVDQIFNFFFDKIIDKELPE